MGGGVFGLSSVFVFWVFFFTAIVKCGVQYAVAANY